MNTIKQSALSGVRWASIFSGTTILTELLKIVVLAHFLLPKDFGLFGMVIVFIRVPQMFLIGISESIINKANPTNKQITTMFWFIISLGIILFLIILLGAPFISLFYQEKSISSIMNVLSFIILISSLGLPFRALLRKYLYLNIENIGRIIQSISITIIAILLAIMGYGVWALVWSMFVGVVLMTATYVYYGIKKTNWYPSFYFNRRDLKNYLSFGLYRGAASGLGPLSEIDKVIIGKFLGANLLGYYNFAFNITRKPNQKIRPMLITVFFPVFSYIKDKPKQLKNGFFKGFRLLSATVFPIYFGLFFIAPLAVPYIFGEKWEPSIIIVQVLAFFTLFRSLETPIKQLILGRGKANWFFYISLIEVILISMLVLFVSYFSNSLLNIAIALTVYRITIFFTLHLIFLKKIIGNYVFQTFKLLVLPLVYSTIMGGYMYFVQNYFINIHELALIIISLIGSTGIYIILLFRFSKGIFVEFLEILPNQYQIKIKKFLNLKNGR